MRNRYTTADLFGQFILCRDRALIPDGWQALELDGWQLGHQRNLQAVPIIGPGGEIRGCMLGWAVSAGGSLIRGPLELPVDDVAAFEKSLYQFAGRYVAVLMGAVQRAYLDPVGSLSAVFSPAHEAVASTTFLVPYTLGCDDDAELIAASGIPGRNGMYCFGTTPRLGIERILPNHYLDLKTWETVRHWPEDGLEVDPGIDDALARIATLTRRTIAAVAAEYPVTMSLTGGRDSRMLLACARDCMDRVDTFTLLVGDDETSEKDVKIARRIAGRMSLTHRVFETIEPTRDEVDLWHYRMGCAIGEQRGAKSVRTYYQLDPTRVELPGQLGEAGRLGYWRKGDTEDTVVSVDELLERCTCPVTDGTRARARRWQAGLPPMNGLRQLDMLYLEMRMGCWGGVFPYGDADRSLFRLYPLAHRDVITAMLRLPTAFRRRHGMPEDVIRMEWPELLEVPFDKSFERHPRGLSAKLRRIARDPAWLFGRIKARLGRA